MSTRDERKSLMSETLPVNLSELAKIVPVNYSMVGPDKVLTSIVEIDEQVARVQEILAPFVKYMQDQRDALMTRALEEHITENPGAVLLEIEGKKMRNEITDIEAFCCAFNEEYQTIREVQGKDIEAKYQKQKRELETSKIPLTLADKYVGKDRITEFVGVQPVRVTYEVRRR